MTNKTKERDVMLTELAYAAANHLRSVGAVRVADNVEPATICKKELCEILEIPDSMWSSVRTRAWELGLPIVFGYFTGYYLGKKGEEARIMVHAYYVLRGIAEAVNDGFFALGKSGNIDDAEVYARLHLNCPLDKFGEIQKVLGSPLPEEAIKVLSSNNHDERIGSGAKQ